MSGISPAPIKMMLSVPVQQIARVYRDQPQCVASIEKQKILDYIPNIQLYSPRISDNALLNFNESKFKKSPEDFFIMWFK